MMKIKLDSIYNDDCRNVLKKIESDSIDLIITSPPYADNRKKNYVGIPIDNYVDWFLPISSELKRVLKPTGSFVLNIKERVVDGERHTYVLELILAMKKQGWLWTEEYMWHKKNCFPGKWNNRFRDAWERCLQFNKERKFKMNQESVMVDVGDWAEKRLSSLTKTDLVRDEAKTDSGFGKKVANWIGREKVYPSNVLHMATECSNRNHAAAYPVELPEWFVKLFTDRNDVVLDPFMGSGTTAIACVNQGRHYIGAELSQQYYLQSLERVKNCKKESLMVVQSVDENHERTEI